jgi:hypothetical protein
MSEQIVRDNEKAMNDFIFGRLTKHDTLTEDINEDANEPDMLGDLYDYMRNKFFVPYVQKMPDYDTNDVSEYPEFTRFRQHLIMAVIHDEGGEDWMIVA